MLVTGCNKNNTSVHKYFVLMNFFVIFFFCFSAHVMLCSFICTSLFFPGQDSWSIWKLCLFGFPWRASFNEIIFCWALGARKSWEKLFQRPEIFYIFFCLCISLWSCHFHLNQCINAPCRNVRHYFHYPSISLSQLWEAPHAGTAQTPPMLLQDFSQLSVCLPLCFPHIKCCGFETIKKP